MSGLTVDATVKNIEKATTDAIATVICGPPKSMSRPKLTTPSTSPTNTETRSSLKRTARMSPNSISPSAMPRMTSVEAWEPQLPPVSIIMGIQEVKMMPTMQTAGLNLMNMKGKVESLQVLTTERKDLTIKMRNEFAQLVTRQHEELMRVRDGKTKATFYAIMHGDLVKDMVMLADTEEGFTVIQLLGNFTLQDIQEITKDMDK